MTSRDGTLLRVEVLGDAAGDPEGLGKPGDRPTFVLAPGWTEETLLWGPVARGLLSRGFRVVVYDLRGQGASGPAAGGDYTLGRYGEDLDAVLRFAASEEGAGGELIVAGHSLGGMAIAAWAAAHPPRGRIRAAALVNTAVSGVIKDSGILSHGVPALIRHWFGVHVVLSNPVPRMPVSNVVDRALVRTLAFGPHATAAQIALLEQMVLACPTAVRTAAGSSMAAMDLTWALTALTVPTMVIAGELDVLLPPAHSERIAAALPSLVDLVVLPEVGHSSPLEASDRLTDELVRLAAPEAAGG